MAQRDILVIGASAGGVEALRVLIAGLPASLPVSVFVVLHLSPHAPSHLAPILERASRLPVKRAHDDMPFDPGHIYVAVPDHHLLLEKDRIRVARGPKENRSRPAIDALFRSAAYHFGPRVIGIVLTGNLDDGTAGLWAIKDRGGLAVVQAPADAAFSSMPESALEHVAVDQVLPVAAIPAALAELIQQPIREGAKAVSPGIEIETRIALDEDTNRNQTLPLGPLVPFTCPECHGSLMQVPEGPLLRYRCHTGHAFSQQTLLAQINEEIEHAFGRALRAIEERTMLLQTLQQRGEPDKVRSEQYAQLGAESEKWAQQVRDLNHSHQQIEQDLASLWGDKEVSGPALLDTRDSSPSRS